MCNKQNLPERVEKARAAMHFSKIMSYDGAGRVSKVITPGSEGGQYEVILRREPSFSVEVNLIIGNTLLSPPWKANHISYHAMAAVMIAAREVGYKVVWFASEQDAKRYARFGGKVFFVSNFNNPQVKEFGVMEKEEGVL